MIKEVFYFLLHICMLAIPTYGQQVKNVFNEESYDLYDKAFDLNESKNYLDAYRMIVLAEKSVNAALTKNAISASLLGDDEFRKPYWVVKKSKAEIAYMLGIYSDMESVSSELHQSLNAKKWELNQIEIIPIVNGLKADIAKIDGSRYYLTEKYDSAEVALMEALRLGSFYGNESFVNKVHDDLAQLYYKQENYNKALIYLDSILKSSLYQDSSRNKEIFQNIKIVQSQRALCLARLGRFTEALKEIETVLIAYKKTRNKRLYAEALRKKAKILMLEYESTGKYNPITKTCYQQYLSVSKDFIDNQFVGMSESEREQYWMTEQPFVTDCFRLEDKASELLYDVALYSKSVLLQMGRDFKNGMTEMERKNALASIRVTWQRVREHLSASSSAIEFIVYEKKGESHLGALVINKESICPKFVDIGKVSDINDYHLTSGLQVKDVFADTQSKDKINIMYNDSILRGIIWNPKLVDAIGNSKDVYFSPDGIFHQMGIEYMTPQSIEGKNFFRLTTTRLLTQKRQRVQTDKMLICGGVEYGFSEKDIEAGNDELAYSLLASMDLRITPLPNSLVEVDSIKNIRGCRSEDMVLCADSVTEDVLNKLLGKYNIVHISTHGLFTEVAKCGTEIRPLSTDVQLSKSCLFLSGAEKNLRQEEFDASRHDGILSARELAKMDLNNIDLAVMSACMSGLGYITPDGVYGLQRGLKTAGVKTVISTLWSIDDEASCFFIVNLYKNLEAGKGLHEAFVMARETLKMYEKTYGNTISSSADAKGTYAQRRRSIVVKKFNKPYFYNAFILIDGLD